MDGKRTYIRVSIDDAQLEAVDLIRSVGGETRNEVIQKVLHLGFRGLEALALRRAKGGEK